MVYWHRITGIVQNLERALNNEKTAYIGGFLVEANQEEKNECPLTKLAGFRDIEPDRLPVILKEVPATLTSTYFLGKQTLKDNYFGQAAIVI